MRDERRKGIWRRRIVLLVGGALILLVLVRGVMDWSASAAMEATVADFEQRWGPLDPAEIGPEEIPASQNRARVYAAAMALLDYDGRADHETLRGRGNQMNVAEAVARDPEAVRALLERNRLPLELMAESLNRNGSDWEIDYQKGMEARAPRLLDVLNLSRLVAARAALAIADQDTPTAVSTLRQGIQLGASLKNEPLILTHLVGVSVEAEMMAVLRALLASPDLTSDDLMSLRVALSEIPGERSFHEALRTEVIGMHMAMADITSGVRSEVMDPRPVFTEGLAQWAVRPVIRRAHNLYLGEMDKIIDRQSTPRFRRPEMVENQDIPWYGKIFSAVPNMEKLLLREDLAAAREGLAWTAVAVMRHKAETGAAPDSLEALVPSYLDKVPVDPFTGKPFEYRAREDGFVLKSAGEDSAAETEISRDPVTTWEIRA